MTHLEAIEKEIHRQLIHIQHLENQRMTTHDPETNTALYKQIQVARETLRLMQDLHRRAREIWAR